MKQTEFFPSNTFGSVKDRGYAGYAAMQLFGNRFFTDETPFELMSEFLLVVASPKKVGEDDEDDSAASITDYLVPANCYQEVAKQGLSYYPKANLFLKLFSIFPNSTSDSPHPVHNLGYQMLNEQFKACLDIPTNAGDGSMNTDNISIIISNLFYGFQGIGSNRDWCAQSFFPLSKDLLSAESIWRSTTAKSKNFTSFNNDVLKNFEHTGHSFYARGGEVLYLQILLTLNKSKQELKEWAQSDDSGVRHCYLADDDYDPSILRDKLNRGFKLVLEDSCPQMIGKLSEFLNACGNECFKLEESEIVIRMGGVPDDAWKEGFLFIQDLIHIFSVRIDAVDRLKLLQIACCMQMLRTMQRSSLAFCRENGLACDFDHIAIIDSKTKDKTMQSISNRSLKSIQYGIRTALETSYFQTYPEDASDTKRDDAKNLKKLFTSYGDKLYLKYCKMIGFVIPVRGGNERFVLDKTLLSFLVVSTLLPQQRMSLQSFLIQLEERYGFVFDNKGLNSIQSKNSCSQRVLNEQPEEWLVRMLDESGYLYPLADSYALVVNNNNAEEGIQNA